MARYVIIAQIKATNPNLLGSANAVANVAPMATRRTMVTTIRTLLNANLNCLTKPLLCVSCCTSLAAAWAGTGRLRLT
jgi:hypothetical protein